MLRFLRKKLFLGRAWPVPSTTTGRISALFSWAILNAPEQLEDVAAAIAPQAQLDENLMLRAARRVTEQLAAATEHGR